jgi:hypothetical protein
MELASFGILAPRIFEVSSIFLENFWSSAVSNDFLASCGS